MTIEENLLAWTEEISSAADAGDRATLERLIHDGFEMRLADGRTFHKAQTIDMWSASSASGPPTHEIADPHVTVRDSVGVVVAVVTDRWADAEGTHAYRERIFDVWWKDQGRWFPVSSYPVKLDVDA